MTVVTDEHGNALEVGGTEPAIRATSYNSAGVELEPSSLNLYHLPVSVRMNSLTGGATFFIWSMFFGQMSKRVYVRRIYLRGCFDGTVAATDFDVQPVLFSGAVPTGGTSLIPATGLRSYKEGADRSQVLDARICSGAAFLTTTGVVVDVRGVPASMMQAHRNASNGELDLDCVRMNKSYLFEIPPNSGLAIRGNTSAVLGDGVAGFVSWEERE